MRLATWTAARSPCSFSTAAAQAQSSQSVSTSYHQSSTAAPSAIAMTAVAKPAANFHDAMNGSRATSAHATFIN